MNNYYSTLALLSTLSFPLYAGGLISYEIGTPDLGLASAGYAARAQDAATVMTNPAGMTRLNQTQVLFGIQPLYGDLEFSPNSGTNVSGNNGGNAVGWFPGGGGYAVLSATENFKLGIASYGNFGMPLRYNGDWVGRYYATKAILLGMTVAPSVALRIHDMWSIGFSLNAMYGMLRQTAAVNNNPLGLFAGTAGDGELQFENNAWGLGCTFGFLFEPTEFTRLGLTYTTEIELDFQDVVQFTNTFPIIIPSGSFDVPLDLAMNVPQTIMFSLYHALNDKLAMLANVGWQNWERFGRVDITVSTPNPRSITEDLSFNNTWHAAFGLQYDLTTCWRFSLGAAYDSSMVSDSNRSVTMPVGSAWRFGAGAQYAWAENLIFGVGYTYLWGGDLSVNQSKGPLLGRVNGSFDDAAINYMGVSVDWKI